MPRSAEWTGTVKSKKTGNRKRPDGTWGKGQYTTYSIAIPSGPAQKLKLKAEDRLKVRATKARPRDGMTSK